ncbi:MAG: MFS transporter [Chlamydiae bacterium]|nr:MFS transporter [Chlamydiota bacterium]MBI3265685.1 MFS transporter [Chlamydiota bacterium]
MTSENSSKRNSSWFTREIFGFGLTSFFSDLAHEVATTLLPVFLASLGAPPYAVGLVEGVADGLANVGKLLGGWLSDRFQKRKSFALAGYVLTGLTQGLFGLVTFWPQALFARSIGWLGRGWRGPIRDALFHESICKEVSGRAFGFERAMDTLGAVIAPMAVFFLVSEIGYRPLFLCTWIPGGLAVLCFAFFIKEKPHPLKSSFSLFKGIKSFSPRYRKFLLAVTCFGLADFSHTILIFWAGRSMTRFYGVEEASQRAILLYVFHNIVYAAASYPMGYWGDKIGKFRVLALGYGLACIMFLGLFFAGGNFKALFFVFVIGGLYVAIQDTLERAIAGDLTPKEIKGTAYGVLASLNGVGDFLSSLMVGILLSCNIPQLAFGYCFLLALFGMMLVLRLADGENHKSKNSNPPGPP